MARKQISLVEDVGTLEEKLSRLLPVYEANKSKMDSYKKLVDKDNKEIKSIMLEAGLREFVVDDIKASCLVSKREDFIEEALIAKLKEMKVRGIVKKKEYVDMDALENAIYHGKIDAAALADCQTKKNESIREKLLEYFNLRLKKGLQPNQWKIILDDLRDYAGESASIALDKINNAIAGGYMQIIAPWEKDKKNNFSKSKFDNTAGRKVEAVVNMTEEEKKEFEENLAKDENGNLLQF